MHKPPLISSINTLSSSPIRQKIIQSQPLTSTKSPPLTLLPYTFSSMHKNLNYLNLLKQSQSQQQLASKLKQMNRVQLLEVLYQIQQKNQQLKIKNGLKDITMKNLYKQRVKLEQNQRRQLSSERFREQGSKKHNQFQFQLEVYKDEEQLQKGNTIPKVPQLNLDRIKNRNFQDSQEQQKQDKYISKYQTVKNNKAIENSKKWKNQFQQKNKHILKQNVIKLRPESQHITKFYENLIQLQCLQDLISAYYSQKSNHNYTKILSHHENLHSLQLQLSKKQQNFYFIQHQNQQLSKYLQKLQKHIEQFQIKLAQKQIKQKKLSIKKNKNQNNKELLGVKQQDDHFGMDYYDDDSEDDEIDEIMEELYMKVKGIMVKEKKEYG